MKDHGFQKKQGNYMILWMKIVLIITIIIKYKLLKMQSNNTSHPKNAV